MTPVALTPAVLLLVLRSFCGALFVIEHFSLARRAWRARAYLSSLLAPGVWGWRSGELVAATRWFVSGVGFAVTWVVSVPH